MSEKMIHENDPEYLINKLRSDIGSEFRKEVESEIRKIKMGEKMNTVDLILKIQQLESEAKNKKEDAAKLNCEAEGIMYCVDSLKKEFEMEIRHYYQLRSEE